MSEKEIRVAAPDGEMTAFVAHPEVGGPFPIAILFMDGMGYREQIRKNARRFAADGYFVVAPDLYYRFGDGVVFDWDRAHSEPAYLNRVMQVLRSVTPDRAMGDAGVVLGAVASDPAAADGPKVCVGYCMGGRLALRAASQLPDMVAAAGIHTGRLVTDQPDSPHYELATVHGELYFAFAETDELAPPEMVERFRNALTEHGVSGVVERLPGTEHSFALADLPVYDEAATERHYERTLDLWRRALAHERIGVSA
jgi:carboxymethylenebutenolidase